MLRRLPELDRRLRALEAASSSEEPSNIIMYSVAEEEHRIQEGLSRGETVEDARQSYFEGLIVELETEQSRRPRLRSRQSREIGTEKTYIYLPIKGSSPLTKI